MRSLRILVCASILLSLFCLEGSTLQAQQTSSNTPKIQVTSRLVFLDVTVLDKKGRQVVAGLTKDDFTITDNKKPQRIFSFEAPESHAVDINAADDDQAGKAPVTIFVLDLLNSSFEDFGYIRFMVRKYLTAQPAQLDSPAELMVLSNDSLQMVQGYTRSKADLLNALAHVPAVVPYKDMSGSFIDERFYQSIDALEQIALQNKGVRGRKNIMWVGHGGPGIITRRMPQDTVSYLNEYVHDATNMLVDSRVSLFVIYPSLKVNVPFRLMTTELEASTEIGNDDPFWGDINFGVFVNETGGTLFYNRNDIDVEIKQSEELGSEYYTLTYQPPAWDEDGNFRRIRVALRDPSLRVVTKAGYFSPNKRVPSVRQQTMVDISEAARSTVPFDSLGLTIENIVRHPDTGTVEFTVVLKPQNLDWQRTDDGKSNVVLLVAAASLNRRRDLLASKLEDRSLIANNQDATRLAGTVASLPVSVRVPHKTQSVRVVIETAVNGRTGAVELDRKMIDSAPVAPTPEPKLIPQPQKRPPPTDSIHP